MKRWAIILCRFADVATEPNPPQFYRNVFTPDGAGTGGVFDYWRDVTYGAFDLTGSEVFGWLPTTKTAADYNQLSFPGGRGTLCDWGVEAALQAGIDLTPFPYIAIIYNRGTDSGSAGGARIVLGVDEWNTSFACHEMGHAFGLPHSFRTNPDFEYGDPFDVMSLFTNFYPFVGTYGQSGPGLVAPQVEALGALPQNRVMQLSSRLANQVTLAALNVPSANGLLALRLSPNAVDPNPCEVYHMLEFRRQVGWDRGIPKDAVVVHELRGGRSYLVSGPDGGGIAAGHQLTTFEPAIHITVERIDPVANTATVRTYTLDNGDLRQEDGSADIFLMWGGAKWRIPSLAELSLLGLDPNDIGFVPAGALATVPTLPRDHTWLVERGPGPITQRSVYVIHRGKKRLLTIALSDAWARFRFDQSDIGVVPPGALAAIPNGPVLDSSSKLTAIAPSFDGDGQTDYVIWRPRERRYYARLNPTQQSFRFVNGESGDVPITGDFNGNGFDEFGFWRPSTGEWITALPTVVWGEGSDYPVPADYDGDGRTDFAVFRPYEATWWLRPSGTGPIRVIRFGDPGDLPAPADYDGDGRCDLAVWRPRTATYFVRSSADCSVSEVTFGEPSDLPVPGDYDGDGRAERALFRPRDGTWLLRSLAGEIRTIQWGRAGDIPVPGDYDGDGATDIAVWRPADGKWYVLLSSTNFDRDHPLVMLWGQPGDIPLAGGFPWHVRRS